MIWNRSTHRRRRNFFRQTQQQRYRARPFQNPYFQRRQRRSLLPFAICGITLGTLIAIGSFLLTSPRFLISSISVEGATSMNPRLVREAADAYLEQRRLLFFRARNRFLYNEDDLRAWLSDQFHFERLDIEQKKQNLHLAIEEKPSTLIWKSGEETFLADAAGVVIRRLQDAEAAALLVPAPIEGPVREGETLDVDRHLLVVIDLTSAKADIAASVFSEHEIAQVLAFADGLQAMNIRFEHAELDRTVGNWLRVVTTAGYDILFDPAQDVAASLSRLSVLLREEIPDPAALEYIDIRFGDHVYYK